MIDSDLPSIRRLLLRWYDLNRRELPWRTSGDEFPDPYRVWLSETMLQQTRVETVKPYFHRWLQRFPTLEALAAAPLDAVLKEWEGLGYYSRARNLHRAVQEVRESYGGEIPTDPDAFRALPGVGRYTAGAVMSIAFDREEPVVDGNVRRVLARLLDDPSPTDRLLWGLARKLVSGERPGAFNQSLMELGATVCTPRLPRCGGCPVTSFCAAHGAGTQLQRPAPRRRGPLPHEHRIAGVVQLNGQLLLGRRPTAGRLGGMWEFPGGLMSLGETAAAAVERMLPEVIDLEVVAGAEVGIVDHAFTHVKVSYHAIRASPVSGTPEARGYDEVRWVAPEAVRALALPRAQQRIAALVHATEPPALPAAQG